MSFKLSVLDQSFTRQPDQASEALAETIAMAQHCEQLGYERFWVSEHHAFPTIAGSAPEVLLAALGAATKTIRLGSGGIMLPHYSAYKMAEVFSVLGNLYPGRIDMGVGRAPGADMSTAMALATDGQPKFERFPQLVTELRHYLRSEHTEPVVSPKPPADLPIWMLGSSADSGQLAAHLGLPYNLGLFISPQASPAFISHYKKYFEPSGDLEAPHAIATMSVFCAETEAEAKAQQHTFDVNFFRYVTGQRRDAKGGGLLTPEEAQDYPMNPHLEVFIMQRSENRAVGTPEQVRAGVERVAERFHADEVMAVTNMFHFADRKKSFELLKAAFNEN